MKNKLIWILSIAVVAAASIFALQKCTNKPPVFFSKDDSAQFYKDQAGKWHAQVIKTQDDFARANFKIDSLARLLKIKPKDLQSFAQVITHGNDSLKNDHTPLVIYYSLLPEDSTGEHCPPVVRMLSETFWNDYYSADVQIDTEGDSSYLRIQSTDTLTVSWRRIKTGSIFNRKEFIALDASNVNPNNTIVGLKGYRVADKHAKKIGIGIQGGYGFSKGLQPQPYIGIGISYNLIRL